jgi:4-hydroxy-3-polyprenylbenzoate decarboxylase
MGFTTIKEELNLSPKEVISLATKYYSNKDLTANISSGSFLTKGMIVAPCSIKTLSTIANCHTDNLITRAADVCLKESRKTVLLLRETPLHLGHIKLMEQAVLQGSTIMPPLPAFYNNPQSIQDMVNHSVSRCLDLFHIKNDLTTRWNGLKQ